MFTGIVEAAGKVAKTRLSRKTLILEIQTPKFSKTLKIGGSLSVNGVCLTVVRKKKNSLFFNVITETLRRSTIKNLKEGDRVNLERPMRLGAFLDGHVVLGHVDAVGIVERAISKGKQRDFFIRFPKAVKPYVVEKGSIAVDGVSLTLGKIKKSGFWVHIIPHTLKSTNFETYQKGTKVNLEADVLTKLAVKHFKSDLSSKHRPKLIDKLRKAL